MLHLVLYGLLAIALAGGLFLVAARFLPAGEQIAPPLRDEPLWDMPSHAVTAEDIEAVRLPVALRGYRFAETDLLLDRLAREIRSRDELISQLRSGVPMAPPTGSPPATPAGGQVAAPAAGTAYEAPMLPFGEAPRVVRPPYGPPPSTPAYQPPPVEHGQYAPPRAEGSNGEQRGYPIPHEHYRYCPPDGIEAPPWAVVPVPAQARSSEGEAAPPDG